MSDLIRRSDLLRILEDNEPMNWRDTDEEIREWACWHWFKKVVGDALTIEAEPVRHRSWVIKTHDDGYGEFNVKHCPDCDAGLPPEFKANYCYLCGAKMDGGEKE